MPRGLYNAYLFQIFNAISCAIVLGAPMILFLKHLGASATVLGFSVALIPLFDILQIPAANFVERIGYRTLIVRGWVARSLLLPGVVLVALLPEAVSPRLRIALTLLVMVGYSVARGFVTCGFLPWITQLIPPERRGVYLSMEQTSSQVALTGTIAATAAYLHQAPGPSAFPILFACSFVAAMISIGFLRRIPDVPVSAGAPRRGRVPWRSLLLHPPFFRLVLYTVAVCVPLAGSGVFWVPLLRDRHGATDSQVLIMSAISNAVSVVSLMVFGRVVDRVGSRPLLSLAGASYAVNFLSWAALAAGVMPFTPAAIVLLTASGGFGGSLLGLANTRLVMSVVPAMGRSHFFALFGVTSNLTLALMPVAWGLALDGLSEWRAAWGRWEWNGYTALYLLLALGMAVAEGFRRRLAEPKAMSTDDFLRELLVRTPSRALVRFLWRRPSGV